MAAIELAQDGPELFFESFPVSDFTDDFPALWHRGKIMSLPNVNAIYALAVHVVGQPHQSPRIHVGEFIAVLRPLVVGSMSLPVLRAYRPPESSSRFSQRR